jgi:hypothetical protein
MSSSPIRSAPRSKSHTKGSKLVGISLASVALSLGIGVAATGGGAAAAVATKAPARLVDAASTNPTGRTSAATTALPARILSNTELRGDHIRPLGTIAYTGNWAGYVATGEKYNFVYGSWRLPEVNCAKGETSSSLTWVGLDGWSSGSVEQLGTSSICTNGKPHYGAWWETVPQNALQSIAHTAKDGDTMAAYVSSNAADTTYTLVIQDETRGWTSTTTANVSPADADATAEWIVERPACGSSCDLLSNFGTVNFSGALATGNGQIGSITSFPYSAVYMSNYGTNDATVSGLTGGSAFNVFWQHS